MSIFQKSLLGAGIVALLSNLFLFRFIGASGVALAVLFFNLFIVWSYSHKKEFVSVYSLGLEISTLFFLFLSVIRATPSIQALLLLSAMGCNFLLVYLFSADIKIIHALREFVFLPFVLAGSYLSTILDRVFSPVSKEGAKKESSQSSISRHLLSTAAGLAIGIPIIFVLVGLFTQADPIFGKLVHDFLGTISFSSVAQRILVTVFVFLFLLPWGLLSIRSQLFSNGNAKLPQPLLYPMTIVMTLVGLTLGIFLVVQWPYVFAKVAAETDLSKFGVATYSEYVKRGFGEFLIIAGVLYSLVWGGLLAIRAKKDKTIHPLQIIQSIVIGLFFVFLLSVGRRILLYWDFHGLSLIRIYGGMFLVWVGFLTTLVWIRHFVNLRFVTFELIGSLCIVAFAGVWNAEQFIITHHPPTVNHNVDVVYLSRMSSDGYEGWLQATQTARDIVNRPEYQYKTILDKNDRRDIAYAGIVIGQLTNNYDQLISRYGSQKEREDYAKELFERESPELSNTARLFAQDLAILQRKGNTATVSASAYVVSDFMLHDLSPTLTEYIPELISHASVTAQLATVSGQKRVDNKTYLFTPRPSRSMSNFSNGTCFSYFFYEDPDIVKSSLCSPSFYTLHAYKTYRTPDALDTMLVWNASNQAIYNKLKMEISRDELYQLQDAYRILWKKILLQSKEERITDLDVSFEAPFVGSID